MKALLNEEGQKLWGFVFPDGEVPVKNIMSFKAHIDEPTDTKHISKDVKALAGKDINVYLVDWAALTEEQRNLILEHLKCRFGSSEDTVEAEILKSGLPLRACLVSCVSIPGRFF
jgi:hypothetical protein